MKVGLMQPYLFPYIGYFQLINEVDIYIIYDDVNYIKNGWINRNQYLLNGESKKFTLSLDKASPFELINNTFILETPLYKSRDKILKTIRMAYRKAPCFEQVMPLIEEIVLNEDNNLARYITNSIKNICEYLSINTKILISSEIDKNELLKGEEKVIDICQRVGATTYVNAIGGKKLYSHNEFEHNGINLRFLQVNEEICYKQFENNFIPNLSIIDVLMFNGIEGTKQLLKQYKVVM